MKYIIKILLIAISVFFLSSCLNNPKSISDLEVEKLKGMLVCNDSLNSGLYPYTKVDSLWFFKLYSNKVNCNVSLDKGDSVQTVGLVFSRGAGPGEYDEISLAYSSQKDMYVLNYSSEGNKLLSLTKFLQKKYVAGDFKTGEKYNLINLPAIRFGSDNFIILSDSTFLVSGAPYNQIGHIFSIINYKKCTLKTLDFWPTDGHRGDSLAKHSVYTDNCKIFKSKNKLLYLCGWERYAFIFEIDGNKVNIKKELFSKKLEYKEIADGNYQPLKINESLGMDTNEEAIYALMIEKNIEGKKTKNYMESQFGNEIQVYDWNGNLKRRIMLDKVGRCIKVSNDNKILYLFTENPKTKKEQIWKYEL